MPAFHEILKATKTEEKWSNRDVVSFHYFNQFGLIAIKNRLDEKISKLVDEGKANSGAILAYGTFNDYYYSELRKLSQKRRVSRSDLHVVLYGLRRDNEKAKKFILEIDPDFKFFWEPSDGSRL